MVRCPLSVRRRSGRRTTDTRHTAVQDALTDSLMTVNNSVSDQSQASVADAAAAADDDDSDETQLGNTLLDDNIPDVSSNQGTLLYTRSFCYQLVTSL